MAEEWVKTKKSAVLDLSNMTLFQALLATVTHPNHRNMNLSAVWALLYSYPFSVCLFVVGCRG
jgi:hypothetical protein